jgi:hypothetical protein
LTDANALAALFLRPFVILSALVPKLMPPSLLLPVQILAPLVAQGHLDVVDHLLPALQLLAVTGTAALLAAILLTAAASSSADAARARALRITSEPRLVSLVALAVPGNTAFKAVRTALRGGKPATESEGTLDVAFPELAALEALRSAVASAVRSEEATDADGLLSAYRASPDSVRASPEFVRGIAADAVQVALEEGDAALISRVLALLSAASSGAASGPAGAVATGVRILNSAQVVCAAKESEGIPPDSVLAAFKALYGDGSGAVVSKSAVEAWAAGSSDSYVSSPAVEPAGRAAALDATRAWISSL